MNPANFQQAMMAGQPMLQGGNFNNTIRSSLLTRFQHQQQNMNGWQSSLQPNERVNLVQQLSTSLVLAQPTMGHDNALKTALSIEAARFTQSGSKDQYLANMRHQLQMLQQKRMQQSQNPGMGQMSNPQVNMQAMMAQPMQLNLSNQGNHQFNPQLSRQMQVSPMPMNGQASQGMQMGAVPNQNQAMQNPQQQQQPGGNAVTPSMIEQHRINKMAQQLLQKATEEDKHRIMNQFSAQTPQQQAQFRQRFGDPIGEHYRRMAMQLIKQAANKMPNQTGQNGMPNNMMGQQAPMMPQPQMQPQMQMTTNQPDGSMDFSQFMTQMQQDAIRSQDSGQLVVPASNNASMMGQNLNGMPMGLNGQMGTPAMNNVNQMQNMMQQQRQQPAMTPQQQQQAAARLQAQMRNQAQNGQASQQNQMSPQGKMNNQSPMPQQRQPGMQPGHQQQQPGATPQQQQRPTPAQTPQMPQQQGLNPQMLQEMMQQAALNGQPKPIRRPLPSGLPSNVPQELRTLLQTCDDDHYRKVMEYLRKQIGPQLQNSLGPMQPNQMGQQPGQQNPMLNIGQNGQMNQAQLAQLRMAAAQRANQAQAQGQLLGQMPPAGQGPPLVPEIIQKMDSQPFPRTILAANHAQMVPAHVTTFGQLKEFIMSNPAMAGQLTPMKLSKYQMDIFTRRQGGPMNANVQQIGLSLGNGQSGGAPGPAPTANMVAPGGLNTIGQQGPQANLQLMHQLRNITVTPQEIMQVRQKMMVSPQTSDDEISSKIIEMKRNKLLQNFHQQAQMLQMQNQQPGAAAAVAAAAAAAASSNAMQQQNQRMSQLSMPQPPQRQQGPVPGQQTPQMTMPTPTQQNKQPTPRPVQQTGTKTPQQQSQAKTLKRPAPEDVVEISDVGQTAQPSGPGANKSAPRIPPTGTAPAPQATDPSTQDLEQRFGAILTEVKSKHKPRAPLALTPEEREQLQRKVEEYKQVILRVGYLIRMYFLLSRHEQRTKQFLQAYCHLADNVNVKEGTLLGTPTFRADEFEAFIRIFKSLQDSMSKVKMKEDPNSSGQKPQNGQANGPQQLNAANLDQHNTNLRQQAAAQGHRRSSSKMQVPQAPTAGPGQHPFDFSTPPPHGVPKYGEGAGNLTADKLNLPRKKQKKDGQAPSNAGTPAQPGTGMTVSPQIGKAQSPPNKRLSVAEASLMPQPPKNPCRDPMCEYSQKGFETQAELEAHMQQVHAPPADPLKFAMETLATTVGLKPDGSAKIEPESKADQDGSGKSLAQVKPGTTPPSGTTPLPTKSHLKSSPAMDRLKTPLLHGKSPAPTSAGTVTDKPHKPDLSAVKTGIPAGDATMMDLLSVDPWKDSSLQPYDFQESFKNLDTFTGDWGNDQALRSPQLTPATTPDTNVTDKTASTRESEVLDGDGLKMTLAVNSLTTDPKNENFTVWKEVENWEPGIVDPDLANDLAAVGIDESMVLRLDDTTDINDWEALFGPGSNIDGNKVPGWDNVTNELVI
ncbi:uncharacterized protein PV09_07447 [Verruconis gallopava]|uniref:Mediator complex subunit 15 KIX domain-containing protein n=1 Tax=Verruconis gallopava TaxID=253628 RepID=A0A0D1XG38_9PEZI|nr:uncharacterized protein PV09_07447 [Verruconis gallopava]KIW01161.1 hypothetical protein PV09_07447 [Verruconis gallopava]